MDLNLKLLFLVILIFLVLVYLFNPGIKHLKFQKAMMNLPILRPKRRLHQLKKYQSNFKVNISIICFCLLFSIYSCKTEIHYNNGIHESQNKSRRDEFYIYNNKCNGVFIEYSQNKHINKIGTYIDGKRNGLWDTLISDRQAQSQLYYVDDTPQVLMAHKIFLGYYKYLKGDFVFLNIVSWDRSDSLEEKNTFQSVSNSVNGKSRAQCNIHMLNTSKTLVDKILMTGVEDTSKKVELAVNNSTNANNIIYYEFLPNDTLVHYAKLIKTKKGRYEMNLSCSLDWVWYYNYIFSTMIASFNPISEVSQEPDK